MTDALHSQLLEPPEVSVTSSSGYALSWLGRTSTCRPAAAFDVEMQRVGSSEWELLQRAASHAAISLSDVVCLEGAPAFLTRHKASDEREVLRAWAWVSGGVRRASWARNAASCAMVVS